MVGFGMTVLERFRERMVYKREFRSNKRVSGKMKENRPRWFGNVGRENEDETVVVENIE